MGGELVKPIAASWCGNLCIFYTCNNEIITMFENKYLYISILSVNILSSYCYVNYEIFQGFNTPTIQLGRKSQVHVHVTRRNTTSTEKSVHISGRSNGKINSKTNSSHSTSEKRHEVATGFMTDRRDTSNTYLRQPNTSTTSLPKHMRSMPQLRARQFNLKCPETEHPLNIGAFEIPTQKDLVLFTKRTLLNQFKSYHEKTMYLLKDIKEATRATVQVEKKCHGMDKISFKNCVKEVNKECVTITKELVANLERQKAEVSVLIEDKICTMTSMKTDPVQLIKILAMEEATLDFALPAFLRLLGGCAAHCQKSYFTTDRRPRLRQLTDQDLVVRHLLTGKNYMQLIKDQTYV